jgi:predicted nucleic acid-binding protein
MRVVLDTNIIVSALIAADGKPAAIIDAWLDGKFYAPACAAHVDELRATLQKPRVAETAMITFCIATARPAEEIPRKVSKNPRSNAKANATMRPIDSQSMIL